MQCSVVQQDVKDVGKAEILDLSQIGSLVPRMGSESGLGLDRTRPDGSSAPTLMTPETWVRHTIVLGRNLNQKHASSMPHGSEL